MGKSDSVIMKEKMAYAMDEKNTLDDRVEALDDFEMLIELIDNANNMAILKLWDSIKVLLASEHDEIVRHAAWICGTAVQNNLKAQAALYIHNIFPILLALLQSSRSTATRAKAAYALSSSLKHWPLAASALASSSDLGYSILSAGVLDPAPLIKRKFAFLVGTLVMQSTEEYKGDDIPTEVKNLLEEQLKNPSSEAEGLVAGLKRNQVFGNLVKGSEEETDVEYQENAIRALVRALQAEGLEEEEKTILTERWRGFSEEQREERGLGGEDGKDIDKVLA
ncbi:hypothetical protein P7C73_g5438, partial [Tremellales sp. Uapishka_1]